MWLTKYPLVRHDLGDKSVLMEGLMQIITLRGILVIDKYLLIFGIDQVAVIPINHLIGMVYCVTPKPKIIRHLYQIRSWYAFAVERSVIILGIVLIPWKFSNISHCVEIVRRHDIPRLDVPNLERRVHHPRDIGNKMNM